MRALMLLLPAGLMACGPLLGPVPEEPTRTGEIRKLLNLPAERVWGAVEASVAARGFAVESADASAGRLRTRPRRYAVGRASAARLRQIADLEPARRRGLRQVAEYWVQHDVGLERSDATATVLVIESHIQVVDRSQGVALGSGLVQVIPQYYSVPSRGVLERELFTAIGSDLYSAEELLFRTRVFGRD